MVMHEYSKYDKEKKKETSITYSDIDEMACAMDSKQPMLSRLLSFLLFFLTPDSLDKAVYVFMNTYDAESKGNSYGIQCYKACSKFVKCISLILWVMLFVPVTVLVLLEDYLD